MTSKLKPPFPNGGKSARSKGFTLIEAMVVSGIIIFLAVFIVPDFLAGQKQFGLRRSAAKLAQDLRRVQELAMSAVSFSCPTGKKMKGYGINFKNNDNFYALLAKCVDGVDVLLEKEKIFLENEVRIKELKKDGSPASSLDVFFYPPDPQTDLAGANQAQIVLTSAGSDIIVEVNEAGLIYVK